MLAPKYIFENGVMMLSPAYAKEQVANGTPVTTNPESLAIVSSMSDVQRPLSYNNKKQVRPCKLLNRHKSRLKLFSKKVMLKISAKRNSRWMAAIFSKG